ncbi:WD40-repeat-containing domain protein [Helicostylum pulchrum]|uniref:F-box domain-containing protein n=1 Tax=Helicostylum pulchrum TaxID=562976 RepID=A0ABP9XW34_9FUNG|nr:WD40-repeat-containing domain protein [Helicostylum pulchrum]
MSNTALQFKYVPNQDFGIYKVKHAIANTLSREERIELLNYIETIGKCDIIGRAPIFISSYILQHLSPKELSSLRLVSRTWNKKVTHDSLWRNICISYSVVPSDMIVRDTTLPIYHDLFQRCLSMTNNWKTMKCRRIELKYHKGPVLSILIANPTRIFTGDIDGRIHVWNAQDEIYVTNIQAHQSHVSCLTSVSKYLTSGSSDCTIAIHDMSTLKKLVVLRGHEGPVTSLVYSKQDKILLFSGSTDRTIRVWDTETRTCIRILHGQENTISALLFCSYFPKSYCQNDMEMNSVTKNKAGYIISGSSDRNIYVWDLKASVREDEPVVINTIMDTNGPITALAVYNESITDCQKNSMTKSTNEYINSRLPINIPTFIAFSAVIDTTISIYSLPGLERTFVETPNIHRSTIWSISTAVIHSKLVTTSGDRTAIIWDLKSPKTSITLAGFDSAVVSSAISPQEELLCFGTEKGTIVLFDLMIST